MTIAFRHTVLIDAAPSKVWTALTDPEAMKQWMGEPEMDVVVATDWRVGSPIRITGFHHARFVNTGTVLHVEPTTRLRYSHLSSLSRLPDLPANHSIIEFTLTPVGPTTSLTVDVSGLPTESIFKHLQFYWRGTLAILKRFVERP